MSRIKQRGTLLLCKARVTKSIRNLRKGRRLIEGLAGLTITVTERDALKTQDVMQQKTQKHIVKRDERELRNFNKPQRESIKSSNVTQEKEVGFFLYRELTLSGGMKRKQSFATTAELVKKNSHAGLKLRERITKSGIYLRTWSLPAKFAIQQKVNI